MKYRNLMYLNHQPKLAGVSVQGILYLSKFLLVLAVGIGIIGGVGFGQIGMYLGFVVGILLSAQIAIGVLYKRSKVPYQINAFVLEKLKGKDLVTYEKDIWDEEFFTMKK